MQIPDESTYGQKELRQRPQPLRGVSVMRQFKKILFVNDFHEKMTPALERAVKLAKDKARPR